MSIMYEQRPAITNIIGKIDIFIKSTTINHAKCLKITALRPIIVLPYGCRKSVIARY